LIADFGIPLDEYPTRCEEQIADWQTQADAMRASGQIEVTKSHEFAADIMNAIVTDTPYVLYGNLPNTGQIPQLPLGAAVETPCLADANGIQPTVVNTIPPQLTALMRTQINVQELTVRALMDENPEHIYHAAMMDPHTAAELDLRQIRGLVDDLLVAHGDWLPPFARKKKAA
jgi:alpha-galactosidase